MKSNQKPSAEIIDLAQVKQDTWDMLEKIFSTPVPPELKYLDETDPFAPTPEPALQKPNLTLVPTPTKQQSEPESE